MMKTKMKAMTAITVTLLAMTGVGLGCRNSDAADKKSGDSGSHVALASESVDRSVGSQPAAIAAHIDGKNFKIDTESGECKVGTECAAKVKLSAQGAYHINKEYPYKIMMAVDPSVDFLGKSEKEIFSKTLGDFSAEEKEATMNVRFKPKAGGDLVLKGTYKMSVCSEQNCQLETQEIAIEVKVKK